jgi:hypothetical protein
MKCQISYCVSWYDPEEDRDLTDRFTTADSRDGWAAALRERGIAAEAWEQSIFRIEGR